MKRQIYPWNWFRFHTGSIKSAWIRRKTRSSRRFRFHTGSIKSRPSHSVRALLAMQGFDSILVRLKDRLSIPLLPSLYQFRFHTGSIKSCEMRITTRFGFRFRFHTGSIKSHTNHGDTDMIITFRFHTGSIKSRKKNDLLPYATVSIPYWFD